MQTLVITARPPLRRLAPRLQIHLPILPPTTHLAHQKVQLAAVLAARTRDDGIALERPRVRAPGIRKREGLVRGCRVIAAADDVQERRRVGALDRGADGEELAAGLGAHHGDRGCVCCSLDTNWMDINK